MRENLLRRQRATINELDPKPQDDLKIDCELEALATHESSLENCKATLEAEWKDLEDAHLKVMARELATYVKESNLNTKVVELADREK
jgi:hypothetical protein